MRVAFVNPAVSWDALDNSWIRTGIGLLSALAKQARHGTGLIDLRRMSDQGKIDWATFDAYVNQSQADVYAISVLSANYDFATECIRRIRLICPGSTIVVGGIHPTIDKNAVFDADYIIYGEGEIAFMEVLDEVQAGIKGCRIRQGAQADLDSLPYTDRELFAPLRELPIGRLPEPFHTVIIGRGCPHRCLAGDTPIHTIDGVFPIKKLVGKRNVMVLTRHPETQEPIYASAINISKTQEMAELVRVHFDDGTHIDCTPDHRFKVFKSKNQFIQESERDVEAQDLEPKQQVRAVRFETNSEGRLSVSTRRDIVRRHARVVMESILRRPLSGKEFVHHKDGDKTNDVPENLVLTDASNHARLHPEIAERMRADNPAKNMTLEWRENISQSIRGKKRTLEQRLRYRESKLGDKNPNYNPDAKRKRAYESRIPEVNHRVVRVERLKDRQDVYCMEVPGVHWFYANRVLVHNCTFCQPAEKTLFGPKVRMRSIENVIGELESLKSQYGLSSYLIHDDCFSAFPKYALAWADAVKKELPGTYFYCQARSDHITRRPDMFKALYKAGLRGCLIGMESGNQRVLDFLKKDTTPSMNVEAASILNDIGITVWANLMVGIPTETKAEVMDTVIMAKTIKAIQPGAILSWASYTPHPGSDLFKYCEENDLSLVKHAEDYRRYFEGRMNPKIRGVDYGFLEWAVSQ